MVSLHQVHHLFPLLLLVSAVRGAVGVDYVGSARMRERERQKERGRTRSLKICLLKRSCVCVVVELQAKQEEEACLECQQIRKCLLSFFHNVEVDMPFRLPYGKDCFTFYGVRYCHRKYLVRGCRSGPVVCGVVAGGALGPHFVTVVFGPCDFSPRLVLKARACA